MRSDGGTDPGGEAGSPAVRDDDGRGSKPRLNNRLVAFIVAALVVVVDQLTKWWAVNALADNPIVVVDFFQFRLTFNTGASFSILTNAGPLLAIVAFGVVGLIVYVLGDATRRLEAVALGMVLGGAVGNLIDRVFRGPGLLDGGVVDFIDFSFFATFNVADAAINIGVVLLLIAVFIKR